jgi:iron complex transport system substrate-binding protein
LQDRLVGDTDYCDYPPAAQEKTKVGGATNPSLEVIASLHPDLVLVTKLNRLETTQSLAELGIPSYATDPHTVADILSSIKTLADVLGAPEAGASAAEDMQRRLDDLQHRIGALPPKRVLFVVWTQPLISTGQHTFLARLQPDFLVFAESQPGNASREVEKLATLPGWKIIHAVRDRHYAVISDAVNRPAPRIVSAIEKLARQLHPKAFAEKPPDTNKETNKETEKENVPSRPLVFAPLSWHPPLSPHGHLSSAGGCLCGR